MAGSEGAAVNAPQQGRLAGRIIAITGATGGIGRALCLAAASQGAQLVLLARNERKLRALHAELELLAPGAALMAPLDLEKALAADYDRIAAAVEQRHGRLDGLVHCAALLGTLTPIELYEMATWCRVMHVNVTAAFALTQVLLPALKQSADPSVIFTSSSVGRRGRAHWGAYAVSKFAIEGLAQVMADELEAAGVRVNTINPGPARTLMRRQAYPSENVDALPLPESLTGPFLKLLGPEGAGLTGQAINCQ
jgi:NAD(P)-dependent dehydrogenase (short-subunit alcohol dehydrogenase family)